MRLTHVLLALGLAAGPLAAHHSFTSVFDQDKPVTLTGSVTKIEWMNPHVWFYIDVKDASGNVVNWACETGPPGMLGRNGWKKDSLKLGDTVTVEAFRAKDGSNNASARVVKLADGRRVFAGTAADVTK
jgi:hypothetical protein